MDRIFGNRSRTIQETVGPSGVHGDVKPVELDRFEPGSAVAKFYQTTPNFNLQPLSQETAQQKYAELSGQNRNIFQKIREWFRERDPAYREAKNQLLKALRSQMTPVREEAKNVQASVISQTPLQKPVEKKTISKRDRLAEESIQRQRQDWERGNSQTGGSPEPLDKEAVARKKKYEENARKGILEDL